jgi:hypothetical protein
LGDEVSVWDVGTNPVIETWSLQVSPYHLLHINLPFKKSAALFLSCSWTPLNMPASSTKESYQAICELFTSSGSAQVWGKVGPLLELF